MVSSSKAQVFTFDYVMGLIMFIVIVVIAGKQLINIVPSNTYNQLYDENIYFSSSLIQPGYPLNWNTANVLIPGIATSNRLDTSKLNSFNFFSYDETKSFFHISNDYLFYFQRNNSILTINGECIYGHPVVVNLTTCEPDFSLLGYNNLVKSSRLLIYNSTIIEMELYSWN